MAKHPARKTNAIASSHKRHDPKPTVADPVPVCVVPEPVTPEQKKTTQTMHQRWTWIGAAAAFWGSIATVGLQIMSYDSAPMTLKVITGVVMGTAGLLAYINRQLHLNDESNDKPDK